ncbi:hypothetical protein CASFOL_040903 [Castilleja foliolosa]
MSYNNYLISILIIIITLYDLLNIPIAFSIKPDTELGHKCLSYSDKTFNSIYNQTRETVVEHLINNTLLSPRGRYSMAIKMGDDDDCVYGHALCRGDVSDDECNKCVNISSNTLINTHCPDSRSAVIWDVSCMVKYSDVFFFTKIDTSDNNITMHDPTDSYWGSQAVDDYLKTLIEVAFKSPIMFAKGSIKEYDLGMLTYLHGVVQCTGKRGSIGSSSVPQNLNVEENNTLEINQDEILSDPGLRRPITSFDVNIRDQIRREYICRGPCQPIGHNYPKKKMGEDNRSFRDVWFEGRPWLEYSIAKDAAFCFYCYLFGKSNMDDSFVKSGFVNWRRATVKFADHVGNVSSWHNRARELFDNFQNQRQSVTRAFTTGKEVMDDQYRKRLTASLQVVRFLLRQGLPFRGDDEGSTSLNQGNFLELLDWLSANNEEVAKVVRTNAPGNAQMISPNIQKQLTNACAIETTISILSDLGDRPFSVMVDESRDCSVKEQMAINIRFVDRRGYIIERFLAIVHVRETTSACLKEALDLIFSIHGLSISRLRGQGYDGASNMRGEFNGLKTLVLRENSSAHYIHCFAHQLQLVVISVCQVNRWIDDFFAYTSMIVNACGSSCKRSDILRQAEHDRLVGLLESMEISSGTGLNQATSLCRPCDTRWGTHYTTICRLMDMWVSVLIVLQTIFDDGVVNARATSHSLIEKMETYDFVFIMILMRKLLGMTHALSNILQAKDQNIENAIHQMRIVKENLQELRDSGWDILCIEVNAFCEKNSIPIIDMEAGRRRGSRQLRGSETVTNYHFFRVEIFYEVVDMLSQEMNNRFPEKSTELLSCISCLSPRLSFISFDVEKLIHLAHQYPDDFTLTELSFIRQELQTYVQDLQKDVRFKDLDNLGDLGRKMVETMKHKVFPLAYRLIELALVLPVATTSVERVFSAMKILKTRLRNKMRDEWMNDCLVVYIEKEIFMTIDDEQILQRFQNMDNRRCQ